MNHALQSTLAPELIFGLVAPVGVDLDLVTEQLAQTLREMNYSTNLLRLTDLMRRAVPMEGPADGSFISSIQHWIIKANNFRQELGDDALAALAISAIRSTRANHWKENLDNIEAKKEVLKDEYDFAVAKTEESPIPRRAYIIRQFKRPEEVLLFKKVYGGQFILISASSPEEFRIKRIQERERKSCGGLIDELCLKERSFRLISQDSKESSEVHGQNVRDAFPLGDVFIDASDVDSCSYNIRRFIKLLFGSNEITPTRDEYGMYLAKNASLRSSDLSRQVGAAVFRSSGEVATLGCNEVPKFGGGTYWAGDAQDNRDFMEGYDPNERRKIELVVDLVDRLKNMGVISSDLIEKGANEICMDLFSDKSEGGVSKSKVMDIIEFGRIIHAEMSAICDASRLGISLDSATLYCTTFPCHLCAKHIVASGIKRVVYLEPYPKSYAKELHSDSIVVDKKNINNRVYFDSFIGVSTSRYRSLFEKGKRKQSSGDAKRWNSGEPQPMIDVYIPSYALAERIVLDNLFPIVDEYVKNNSPGPKRPAATEKSSPLTE